MNQQIFYFFYNLAHQSDFWDQIITFFAVWFPYLVIIIAGVFILMHHDVHKSQEPFKVFLQKKKEIIMVFFAGILARIIAFFFKFIINAPRPYEAFTNIKPLFEATGSAFPSGHATFFMALGCSIYLLHKKAGYIFIFFALIISIARVIAGVHSPADILAGFALGALVALFSKKYLKQR